MLCLETDACAVNGQATSTPPPLSPPSPPSSASEYLVDSLAILVDFFSFSLMEYGFWLWRGGVLSGGAEEECSV